MQSAVNTEADYHIHTSYSDGTEGVRSVVEHAVQNGMKQIAVTDHMPLPFKNRYAMKKEQLEDYRDEVKRLQDEYSDHITVLTGLEMEYIPGYEFWSEEIVRKGWDHSIASVHVICTESGKGMVNGTADEFKRTRSGLFGGDMRAFCTAYYRQIQTMIDSELFHAVGHMDVIKKHNKNSCCFDENENWYRDLIFETLEHLERSAMQVEINTGGFHHPVGASYPSSWVISECLERGIPLILSSDSHSPRHIGRDFDRVKQIVDLVSAPEEDHLFMATA